MSKHEKLRYKLWKIIYPVFIPVRDFLLRSGVIAHSGRQPFLLGKIVYGKTPQEFKKHVEKQGFHNHFVAWNDDSQLMSLRKMVGTEHQYHLRVFKDGEVRGHYEYTPESHPIQHYYSNKQHPKTEEFLKFLDGWIDPDISVLPALERIRK